MYPNGLRPFNDARFSLRKAYACKFVEKKLICFVLDWMYNYLMLHYIYLRLKGMADSKEFASEVFVALSRRRHINPDDGVTKEQLKEFWEEMTDQNFDSRLRIFFDM